MKRFFVLSTLFLSAAFAEDAQDEVCGKSPRPMRITARHIEANGIGYNKGYTTLDGFFAPTNLWKTHWVPFLDLRAHIFNDGRFASNAGIGGRYVGDSRVWGFNGYYDYRDTRRDHYHQITLGFESLGKIWDYRVNGYIPVGSTKSKYFSNAFKRFEGHRIIISRTREFSLGGVNAEVGAHVDHFKNYPLYFAAGPYYLHGDGKSAWGGQLRGSLKIYDYVRLEANTSYDNRFKWIGQGQISLIFPFGRKRKVQKRNSSSCDIAMTLSRRALQPVDRFEIIPVDRREREEIAKKGPSCDSYYAWFVNNLCSSNGTAESPYPLLQTALNNSRPGDIIYVYSGNGNPYTIANGGSGFTLKQGQCLFGSGTNHPIQTQFGTIVIPAQTSDRPTLNSSDANGPIVSLVNNNKVAGFNILFTGNQNGVEAASEVGTTELYENAWVGTELDNDSNAFATTFSGSEPGLSIYDSTVTMAGISPPNTLNSFAEPGEPATFNGMSLSILAGSPTVTFNNVVIQNISLAEDAAGIRVENAGSGRATVRILNTQVKKATGINSAAGVSIENSGTGSTCLLARNNRTLPSFEVSQTGGTFIIDITSGNNKPNISVVSGTVAKKRCAQ